VRKRRERRCGEDRGEERVSMGRQDSWGEIDVTIADGRRMHQYDYRR
jgi:hypothetical protein